MKVQCPSCFFLLSDANINLNSGWGKCSECGEIFPLAEVLPSFRASESLKQSIQRPFNARAMIERNDEVLYIYLQPEGMRTGTVESIRFTMIFLGFVAFWTFMVVFAFGNFGRNVDWMFASFSIPMWLAGIGMMGNIAWKVWGTKSLRLSWNGLQMRERCLIWHRFRSVKFDQVQHARSYDPQVKVEGACPHIVEILYRGGSFTLDTDSATEKWWLITEINDFVKALAA